MFKGTLVVLSVPRSPTASQVFVPIALTLPTKPSLITTSSLVVSTRMRCARPLTINVRPAPLVEKRRTLSMDVSMKAQDARDLTALLRVNVPKKPEHMQIVLRSVQPVFRMPEMPFWRGRLR